MSARATYINGKAIGDYIYAFEYRGFDEYRIIGKAPIVGKLKFEEIKDVD